MNQFFLRILNKKGRKIVGSSNKLVSTSKNLFSYSLFSLIGVIFHKYSCKYYSLPGISPFSCISYSTSSSSFFNFHPIVSVFCFPQITRELWCKPICKSTMNHYKYQFANQFTSTNSWFANVIWLWIVTVVVLRPGEPVHLPGLRPKFFAIFYLNSPEYLI